VHDRDANPTRIWRVLPGAGSKRFEMLRCLGEGGMGVVYEAVDRVAGVRVALKTLRHANPEALARLKREFRAMQDLQHPSLVGLRELVAEEGRWYLVMDLVEGVDFVSWVRAVPVPPSGEGSGVRELGTAPTVRALPTVAADTPVFDEGRLRAALRQLVEALAACHRAGFVHRDVKPSNVLVTPAGKVVVLDFGLVVETRADASTLAVVGTPTYMAPEQAASDDVGPEADLYSVGVLMYEALTARAPIEGAALQVMLRKQSERPASPREVAAGVPADLDAMCMALLSPKPSERPTAAAVLRALGGERAAPADDEGRSRTLTPPFVGREEELEALADAFAESRIRAACALVEGESGLGKSRLVRHFAERVAREDPNALVLFGRCYERESVPFKAFDGVVDALARFLAKLPDIEARAFLPTRPAALAQVFPVLRRVGAIVAQLREAQLPVDPFELQSRAFTALREMLARIADRRPLVVVIDDGQWADDDSHRLLAEVLREPDAPRMLLVATVRGEVAPFARVLGPAARTMFLEPLENDAARELATLLLQRAAGPGAGDASSIAADAGGHPLFIDLLARRRAQSAPPGAAPSSVEDALRGMLSELDPAARAIVETVALADAPLRTRVVAAAAMEEDGGVRDSTSPGGDSFLQALQRLRVSRLVVSTGARGDAVLEPYHDRVRAAALADMPPERRVERHRRIALALESAEEAEPRALALHWAEAGDGARSARYAALAGDRAAQALAFDRAASFYEQALAATQHTAEERRALLAKLGDALANGGRGKRAADALREAAIGAPAAEALELRRRSADQLLRSGHFDEGVPALEAVLRSVRVRFPATTFVAILCLLLVRTWLAVRGLGYRRRDTSQVSPEALARVDTCYAAALGLAMSDQVRGAALQAASLLAALRLGEPYRAARAIALEQGYASQGGTRSWPRTQRVMERASREALECGHPLARGLASGVAGVAGYLAGRFVEGLADVDRGVDMIRDYGRDVSLETANGEIFAIGCLAQLGRLRELRERVSRYLPEKERVGDLYGAVNMRIGWANLAWLAADDVDAARAHVDDAMRAWSRRGFHVTHYYELLARTNLSLYAGDAREAHAFLEARWRPMWRSLIPGRIQSIRVSAWDLRARACLAVAAADASARDALLRTVATDASALSREALPHATARALTLRAAVAHLRSDRETSVRLLGEALASFDALEMNLNAGAIRMVLSSLVPAEEAAKHRESAATYFATESLSRPARFVSMLLPGFAAEPSAGA
jgi:hypothetical protein